MNRQEGERVLEFEVIFFFNIFRLSILTIL